MATTKGSKPNTSKGERPKRSTIWRQRCWSLKGVLSLLFGVFAIAYRVVLQQSSNRPYIPPSVKRYPLTDAEESFLKWFEQEGGWMSSSVTLGVFERYGLGLYAKGNGVRTGEELVKVPNKLIFSATNAKTILGKLLLNSSIDLDLAIRDATSHKGSGPNDAQIYLLALHLMWECCIGKSSFFYPYLSTLPKHVPRLDTFTEKEMDLVQDPATVAVARQSRRALETSWNSSLVNVADALGTNPLVEDGSCLTWDSFHRFVGIIGSRSNTLHGGIYLAPMADKINFAPNPNKKSYELGHAADGTSRSVLADRDCKAGQQIFQDYGGNFRNNWFFVFSGFVPYTPEENPNHCALVPVPQVTLPELVGIMEALGLEPIQYVCAFSAHAISQPPHAWQYLGLAALPDNPKQMQKCLKAYRNNDGGAMGFHCTLYWGSQKAARRVLQNGALNALAVYATTLDEDRELLQDLESVVGEEEALNGMNREHAILAVRYRMLEKEFLGRISKGK